MTGPVLTAVVLVDSQRERCARALNALRSQSLIGRMEILLLDFATRDHPPIAGSDDAAVRIIPVPGRDLGEMVEFCGLLGSAPIMPVNACSSAGFIRRGGRIPAPIHSLRN